MTEPPVKRPPLSTDEQSRRRPPPPEQLVDALQDPIGPTSGRLLSAMPIRTRGMAR